MRIYFEGYQYPAESIVPYLKDKEIDRFVVPVLSGDKGRYVESIGYLFVASQLYSGPIFLLPKSFLQKDKSDPDGKLTLLGMPGIVPEGIIDSEDEDNILSAQGHETFLPELSLWLFRAMSRYVDDCKKENDLDSLNDLDYRTPDHGARDRDFLSTAVHLIDFLSDHRNLFTQINKINNSGRAAVNWRKTIQQDPYIKEGKPYYLDLRIKDKAVNIDEELIILYYSVLKYLRDKFHFPIVLGDIPYDLKSPSEIQRYLDTGVGKRKMRDMKGKYFRDDLKNLWTLLDAFFTFNTSRDDKDPLKESLVVKDFEKVFEKMVDHLIGDTGKLADLKNQKDGKLVDHIYLDKSLIGKQYNIYYIGDSKYYQDGSHPEGVSLYKQFTYARNTIQFNIKQFNLEHKKNPNAIRYRDEDTDGYNITPNFFISPKIEQGNLDFNSPSFAPSDWIPKPNKHYEDRLFDRDTLLLREYNINLIFLIAAYGAYEDCWTNTLRKTIREDMIQLLNNLYIFFEVVPEPIPVYSEDRKVMEIPFLNYHHNRLRGKVYKVDDKSKSLIIAFEREGKIGQADYEEVRENIATSISGGSIDTPIEIKP